MSGCAANEQGREGRRFSDGTDCFFANTPYDWRSLDDQNLVVWAPSRRCPYHVELFGRCHGLRFTDTIAFLDRDGRICPYGGDAIVVDGISPEECRIASIRRVTEHQLQALYVEFGLEDPPIKGGELREECLEEKLR